MTETTIDARNLTKVYKLYDAPFDRVLEAFHPFGKNYHRDFYALNDVSLKISRGESVGIIGRNGHGKSTLLKLISGTLAPTSGSIQTSGSIAAILELSSNLNAEVTGLGNIELNLRLAGTPKSEFSRLTDEISEFAELGDFIGQPVKTYSSGMKSRLGFAIATSINADILLLDEVLAVGDFEFQQRCLAKINELRQDLSMLFVSHSMNSIRHFCDRAIVLESGTLQFDGPSDAAIEYFMEKEHERKQALAARYQPTSRPYFGDLFMNEEKVEVMHHNWNIEHDTPIKMHSRLSFSFEFRLKSRPKRLIIGIPIWDTEEQTLKTSILSDFGEVGIELDANGYCKGTVELDCCLAPGTYLSSFNIRDGNEFLYRQLNQEFSVLDSRRNFGDFTHQATWRFKQD